MIPVLVKHDPGCRYARERDGGHSDASKRLSDTYNLHRLAGGRNGQVFAVRLSDGTTDGVLYDTRAECVRHQHHNEHWYAYVRLGASSMTICEAASVLYMARSASHLQLADRDDKHGGMTVIPRLTAEDFDRQIRALRGELALPIAIGYER